MAIYHLNVRTMSRSRGQNMLASMAYRSGEELLDKVSGKLFKYRKSKGEIAYSRIYLPIDKIKIDRQSLWTLAEASEKRKDAEVGREFIVSLPNELSKADNREIIDEYSQWLAGEFNVAVDSNYHSPSESKRNSKKNKQSELYSEEKNEHAHITITTRRVEVSDGKVVLKDKTREFNEAWRKDKDGVSLMVRIREKWAKMVNDRLLARGIALIDHRTLEEQGVVDREPVEYVYREEWQMELNGKELVSDKAKERVEKRKEQNRENKQRKMSKEKIAEVEEQVKGIIAEAMDEGKKLREEMDRELEVIQANRKIEAENQRQIDEQRVVLEMLKVQERKSAIERLKATLEKVNEQKYREERELAERVRVGELERLGWIGVLRERLGNVKAEKEAKAKEAERNRLAQEQADRDAAEAEKLRAKEEKIQKKRDQWIRQEIYIPSDEAKYFGVILRDKLKKLEEAVVKKEFEISNIKNGLKKGRGFFGNMFTSSDEAIREEMKATEKAKSELEELRDSKGKYSAIFYEILSVVHTDIHYYPRENAGFLVDDFELFEARMAKMKENELQEAKKVEDPSSKIKLTLAEMEEETGGKLRAYGRASLKIKVAKNALIAGRMTDEDRIENQDIIKSNIEILKSLRESVEYIEKNRDKYDNEFLEVFDFWHEEILLRYRPSFKAREKTFENIISDIGVEIVQDDAHEKTPDNISSAPKEEKKQPLKKIELTDDDWRRLTNDKSDAVWRAEGRIEYAENALITRSNQLTEEKRIEYEHDIKNAVQIIEDTYALVIEHDKEVKRDSQFYTNQSFVEYYEEWREKNPFNTRIKTFEERMEMVKLKRGQQKTPYNSAEQSIHIPSTQKAETKQTLPQAENEIVVDKEETLRPPIEEFWKKEKTIKEIQIALGGNIFTEPAEWKLRDRDGTTVAHAMAHKGNCELFKDNFDVLKYRDRFGWTVAHEMAMAGHSDKLTDKPDLWKVTNNNGTSVANIMALNGYVFTDTSILRLANNNGWTVAHSMAYKGNGSEITDPEILKLADKDGCTVQENIDDWIQEQKQEQEQEKKKKKILKSNTLGG